MTTEKFTDETDTIELPAKRNWVMAAMTSAGIVLSGLLLSPWGARTGLAHNLLADPEFAESFRDGAFKHLQKHHAQYIKGGSLLTIPQKLSEIVPNFIKSWKLQGSVEKELKQAGVTRREAWRALTSTQKACDFLIFVPLIGYFSYGLYKSLEKKPVKIVVQGERQSIIPTPPSETLQPEPGKTKENFASDIIKGRENNGQAAGRTA